MSAEILGESFGVQGAPESLAVARRQFSDGIRYQARNPLDGDPYMATFFRVVGRKLQQGQPELIALADKLHYRKPYLRPTAKAHHFLRDFQYEFIDLDWNIDRLDLSYPNGYDDDIKMSDAVDGVLAEPDRRERIEQHYGRDIKSNIDDRYASLHLILRWLNEVGRAGKYSLALDFGCSENHGLIRLGWNETDVFAHHVQGQSLASLPNAFEEVNVMKPLEGRRPGSLVVSKDEEMTFWLGDLLSSSSDFAYGIGIDRDDINDEEIQRWAFSNSFYPHELANKRRVERYRRFAEELPYPPKVKFWQGDILDEESAPYLYVKEPFAKVVTMFTMLYAQPPPVRQKMVEVAQNCLVSDGILIIQDFARIDPHDPTKLLFYESWNQPYRYRTFILDKLDSNGHFQEIFIWDGGRCRNVQLGMGSIAVGEVTRSSFSDFLREAM